MLVGRHMTRGPVTVTPTDTLATAQEKMQRGGFHRLPVVAEGRLVGIITDRDLRQHLPYLDKTKLTAAMIETVLTVTPGDTLEAATELMLDRKIGGLPVLEGDKLVGIITTSDVLKAYLVVTGASEEGTTRIDLLFGESSYDLTELSRIITAEGGEVYGFGTYRERWDERPILYVRVQSADPARIVDALTEKDYAVLGVHAAPRKKEVSGGGSKSTPR